MKPIIFALLTAMFWGLYGPVLAKARTELGPVRPWLIIGVAYFVVAIGGGYLWMWLRGESLVVSGEAVAYAFAAGTLGALGALMLTMAMVFGGVRMPHVVMPIVFGGATVIAGIIGWWQTRQETTASPWLWVGIVGMLLSTVVMTLNTPHAHPSRPGADASAKK